MVVIQVFQETLRRMTMFAVGAIFLWQAAERCAPPSGTVIVHVAEVPSVVTIDDQAFPVDAGTVLPLVCARPPGKHLVRMSRGETQLYQELIDLKSGEEQIVTAWQPTEPVLNITNAQASARTGRSVVESSRRLLSEHSRPR